MKLVFFANIASSWQKNYLCHQITQHMILSNYHTHTNFSDGKSKAEDYCKKAIELGFHSLGFSDHAPVPFASSYSIPQNQLISYFSTIETLIEEYKGRLKIFLSLEADYIPNHSFSFDSFRKQADIDYIIGSIHMVYHSQKDQMWFIDGGKQDVWDKGLDDVFEGDIKKAVKAFYHQSMEMIETQKPEVMGHLDKIKMHNKERLFSLNDKWYQDLLLESLELIKQNNMVLEINTRGLYKGRCKDLFPSESIIIQAQKMGVPMMLSSDAHHPDELNGAFPPALEKLKKIGLNEVYEFGLDGWKSLSL